MKKMFPYVIGCLCGISLTVIIFIAFRFVGTSVKQSSATPPLKTEQAVESESVTPLQQKVEPKQWVTVVEMNGNSNKNSDTFALTGAKCRLIYKVSGEMSVWVIYVVKEGHIIEQEGGSPDVMISMPSSDSADSTFLMKGAGNYYLDVNSANANWAVKIEEYR